MFKSPKKSQQHYYDDQEMAAEGSYYLSDKDFKALQKKAKKEYKKGNKKQYKNSTDW